MGWFDEQIKSRIKKDDEMFEQAFRAMADVVMPENAARFEAAGGAIEEIMVHLRVKKGDVPEGFQTLDERLEYIFRPSGVMRRYVRLKPGWSKNAVGAMLVEKGDRLVALIPHAAEGYWYTDEETGKRKKVTKAVEATLGVNAVLFYKPLPPKELKMADLFKFMMVNLSRGDVTRIVIAMLFTTLLGMAFPYITSLLFNVVVPSQSLQLLLPITVMFAGVAVSTLLINVFRLGVLDRATIKLRLAVTSASMMRLLSLPVSFYNDHSAGELFARMRRINHACRMMMDTVFTTGFSALFSLLYIAQIFSFTPSLAGPATAIIGITVVYSMISVTLAARYEKKYLAQASKVEGLTYSLVSGIQKIKLTGSEKRVFAKWADAYTKSAQLKFRPPWYITANETITVGIALFGTLALYFVAGSNAIPAADYMAFTASYGLVFGAFIAFSEIIKNVAEVGPAFDMAKPILQSTPEVAEEKRVVSRLMGGVELNNVTFSYGEGSPKVLDNLSLKIRSGQYVAVVGKTGCGKSTLIRTLLGFVKPDLGSVYYDGIDLGTVDLTSLRRKIGVVTQEGKLFEGDIFSNITICAPQLSQEEAWEAAEIAGVAEDIRNMPLGMGTLIAEGGAGVSGGQRQRLMIARAVAPRPRVLIFDEATSALDNITQRKVSDALENLKCTRIVVAHRLSTIKNCDRIVVLDGGKIIEDGTFDELIAEDGFFAELVSRQMLDQAREV